MVFCCKNPDSVFLNSMTEDEFFSEEMMPMASQLASGVYLILQWRQVVHRSSLIWM